MRGRGKKRRGEKTGGKKQDGNGGGRENDRKDEIITLKDPVLCKQCNVCNCVITYLVQVWYASMYHHVSGLY